MSILKATGWSLLHELRIHICTLYPQCPYHNPSVEEPPSCSPITQSNTSSPIREIHVGSQLYMMHCLPVSLGFSPRHLVLVGHICATYISFCYVRGRPETPRIPTRCGNQPNNPTNQSSRTHRWYQRQIMRPCQDLLHRISPISNCQEFAIDGE